MKILVCGDRNWVKRGIIKRVISQSGATVIIHGDCWGADRIAGEIASSMGLEVRAFPADWAKFGKAAGPSRNKLMLLEKPDRVIAFHDDIENSKGTKHMVSSARKAGIPVSIISGKERE